jgi:hypothetical protein
MKKCPTCNKTYSDDSMSFCLEDGAPLLSVGGSDAPSPGSGQFDPNLTIPFTPPRDTAGGPGSSPGSSQWGAPSGGPGSGQYGSQPGGYGQQGGGQSQPGSQWGGQASGQFPPPQPSQFPPATGGAWGGQAPPPPSYATPQKKSSALPWVLGGIALLVVLGVGAAVVIGVLASMGSNSNKNNSNNSNQATARTTNRNGSSNNSNNSNASNSNNTNSTKTGTPSASDDFSSQAWWTGTANVGSAEYQNGEYHLRATSTGYMVIYSPDTFRTENSTTRVTVRSVSGTSPENGYGMAVFGEMSKKKELEDYCLLIRNTETPAYKIVRHRGGNETVLVDWTDASQIRAGTSPNQLEARTSDTQIAFYINGQFVQTITADKGYAVGLTGFYTSGTEDVAFDDLQIFK